VPDLLTDIFACADIKGPDECWEWRGKRGTSSRKNYGSFRIGKRQWPAHRLVYMLTRKVTLPRTALVCHTCDNPPCINPAHLWLGSVADNNADRDRKGRHRIAGIVPMPSPSPTAEFLTEHEVACLLNVPVHPITRALKRGELVGRHLSARSGWRITRQALDEWVED
jgi:excisionase family DNA binding protein